MKKRVIASVAWAFLLPACGDGSGGSSEEEVPDPPEVHAGEIGIFAGTTQKGSDPIDEDGDGAPDVRKALASTFDQPLDVTPTAEGVLVVDWNGHKIRRIRDAQVESVAGTGVEGDACRGELTAEGCAALSAELNHPTDVAVDPEGRLMIAAWHNSKLKRCDPEPALVVDVCGTGNRKFEGDDGACRDDAGEDLVSFDLPSGVVYDADGGLLVADQANQIIRRLAPDGVIRTVVGNCPGPTVPGSGCPEGRGYAGDGGPATQAKLSNSLGQGTDPQGKIALDGAGNLYIADTGNHVIRKVTPGNDGIFGEGPAEEEVITTFAGTGEKGTGGDGGPAVEAQLTSPSDVAVGPDGSVYVADRGNNCIRRVDPDGMLTTIAGVCGEWGPAETLVPLAAARLRQPYGVAVDVDSNRLYIADTLNHCIRQMLLDE
jgi:sugar lactone lactonase YvrE